MLLRGAVLDLLVWGWLMWGYTVLLAMVLHFLLRMWFGTAAINDEIGTAILVWLLCFGVGRWAAGGLVAMKDKER